MRKCRNCQVTILDDTLICPLCHSVLEGQGTEKEHVAGMYPDVKDTTRKLNFVVKLYTFLAIVIEVGLIVINYMTFSGLWWSAICGVGILYFYLTLRYSIQKNSGYLGTILMQIIAATAVCVAVDFIVGYRGWSVNFVIPSAVLLLDLVSIILMLVNVDNWQSYILMQMMTVIFSILILILWRVGVIVYPVVAIIAAAVSGTMFIGTLIFGDRRAKNELKRRFHV